MCLMCERGLKGDEVLDVVRGKIVANGWSVIGIEGTALAYTAGLTERGWPELVVTRLPAVSGQEMLNKIAVRCWVMSGPPVVGSRFRVAADDLPEVSVGVVLRRYPRPHRTLYVVNALYRDRGYTALEVCPDPSAPPVVAW